MLKKSFYSVVFFLFILSSSLYSQYYGRVLSLDNNRGVRWEDIGTILANYSTYHPGTSFPAWITSGNTVSASDFLGSINNMPVIFRTNNIERMRISESGFLGIGTTNPLQPLHVEGNVQFSGAFMPNGSAGTSGQVLVSQGSGNPPVWQSIASAGGWSLSGNSLTGTERFGSTNDQPVTIITNNTDRIRITTKGQIEVLNSARSVFLGEGAGANQDNSSDRYNSFIGYQAGYYNTSGSGNTAIGHRAYYSNSTGNNNTATGYEALFANTSGSYNAATGYRALYSNNTGNYNSAIGVQALNNNTSGSNNTAAGYQALYRNSSGYSNTATGFRSLYNNTTGNQNTAYGYQALYNSTGNNNTALGYNAGYDITTGSNNICIGFNAQPSSATVNNEVTIGNSSNNSYRMYAASWTNASDARYKHDIKDLPYGLDFILKLRPRQFVYNNSTDEKITMGFVAQEVQDVMKQYGMVDNYNLVKIMEKDFLGLNTTEIIPILTKAVQEQQEQIATLQKENEELKAQLQNETAKLQSETEALKAENEQMRKRLELLERLVLDGTTQPETLGAK